MRCMELMDDVCATAALTEEREEYMVLVEVVHNFCAAAAAHLKALRLLQRQSIENGMERRCIVNKMENAPLMQHIERQ